MTTPLADRHVDMPAAYVHIPFCSAVCPYCDFAVVAGQDDLADRYVDAVCAEIVSSSPWRNLEAVYFGGGTPSRLSPGSLSRILDALASRHGLGSQAEVSLEANPEDFDHHMARNLLEIGFNRVSFGAQSFDDAVLCYLGRRHDGDEIGRAVRIAREAGFENVSLDLMFGSPVESPGAWSRTLEAAIVLEPSHVSCYALTVEPGTPLGRRVRAGADAPDPDVQADRYEQAGTMLHAAGYQRYEVSNWSLPGQECRYNLVIWAQGEYEAYGNGAHGHRRGRRFRNVRRLEAYMRGIEETGSARAGEEQLTGWDAEIDRLFVGLRRSVGVAMGPGVEALMDDPDGRRLLDAGIMAIREGRLVVDQPLLSDEVHRCVLGLEPPRGWDQRLDVDMVSGRGHA